MFYGFFVSALLIFIIGLNDSALFSTDDYIGPSLLSVFSFDFWTKSHPFGIKLIYKIFGPDAQNLVTAQKIVLSFFGGVLAMGFLSLVEKKFLKIVICLFVTCLCLWSNVSQWSVWMLSESFNISIFFIWAGLLIIPKRNLFCEWLLLFSGILLIYIRDSNIVLVSIFCLFKFVSKNVRIVWAIGIVFAVCLAGLGKRGDFATINNICNRVLPYGFNGIENPEKYIGKVGSSEFDPYFMDWIKKHGKVAYIGFIIKNPKWILKEAWKSRNVFFGEYAFSEGLIFSKVNFLFPVFNFSVVVILALISSYFSIGPLCLLSALILHGGFSWIADWMEPERHCMLGIIGLQIAGMWALILILNKDNFNGKGLSVFCLR